MTPERWQQIDRIFKSALEVSSARREAFLEEACAGDAELRREVESLIEHDRTGGFLETPVLADAAHVLSSDVAKPETGQLVGHYKVVKRLGVGGMGEVFLARDERLNRQVALKLLSADFTGDDERVQRFRQEALAASALNHPNIITIHEIGQWAGRDFIATEFVDGVTLRQRMRGGKLSLASAVDIALQIASALSAAHAARIVHRDIKPENVMLRPDGLVKVLDFGIAKYTEATGGRKARAPLVRTATGAVIGTAAYMSPEQARGQETDARTDIWALGVILYEMVARRLPFPGATPTDRLAALIARDPAPLSRARRGVPEELQRIVGRALEKDRERRYAGAEEMASDLQKLRPTLGEARPSRFVAPLASRGRGALAWPRAFVVAAVALLFIAAFVWAVYFRSPPSGDTGGGAATIDSLAVLPFVNASDDPEVEYFTDGITESLINSLSELRNVKVMSRSSVFRYKGREADAKSVGETLGVRAVLTGRVAQRGDQLSVSVELIDASDNTNIWGNRYDRRAADVLAVQQEIARDISEHLRRKLTGEEMRRVTRNYTDNVEAYRLYLKGQSGRNRHTPASLKESIGYYDQAIALDPDYALAYTGLAYTYGSLANVGVLTPNEGFLKAKQAAESAVRIDESLAEAHAAVAFVKVFYEWDWAGAERESRRAIELNENFAMGHALYGSYLNVFGRHEEALEEYKRWLELDPLQPLAHANMSLLHRLLGRHDEAIAYGRKSLEIEPHFMVGYEALGLAYESKGMYAEALDTFQKGAENTGRMPGFLSLMGHVYAVSGRRAEALRTLAELKKMSEARPISAYWFALIYAGLGDNEQALAWLEKSYAERYFYMQWLKVDPRFAALRPDPRYQSLIERIGLSQH